MNKKLVYKSIFNWKFLLGFLISILCCYYSFKEFNVRNFIELISETNGKLISLGVLLLIISVYFRALRWRLLFRDPTIISNRFLYDAQLIGYFGNNVLPLRLGELLRSLFISKKYKYSTSYTFGTIILERSLDMLGAISLAVILLVTNYSIDFGLTDKYNFLILTSIIIVVIIVATYYKRNKAQNAKKNKFLIIIYEVLDGFSSISSRNIINIVFYTIIIWSIYVLEVIIVQQSINLGLNIQDCIFVLIISTLALSIPSSPANIGTFEAGVIYSLGLIGIMDNQVEFAIILHSMTFFPYTIIGGFLFIYHYYFILDKKL